MNFRILLFLLVSTVTFAQKGTISGTILDKDMNDETLPFANVLIKGSTIGTTTDENGKYSLSVDPGSYTLEISFLGYETLDIPITVKAGQTLTINKSLTAGSGVMLQDVVVQASSSREKESALLLDQQKAVEIKQSIGAQEMSRKGVSDVEQGLTKITGITKVESRGLFIRGLEDRYNNLLVNGLAVPSNSPFKKIIPLDLFPTDVVGYMDVYKTFNPDIYGDFAGGTVNINTSQATQNQTKVSFGTGFTTNNNLSKFLISSDAKNTSSYFGFGGNERDLPSSYGNIPSGQINNDFTSGYNVDEFNSPLNTSFGITHSGKFKLGEKGNRLNYLFSTNYDNKYQIREGVDRIFSQGQGIYDNDLRRTQYRFQTQSSTLLGLQYKTDRLNISSNVLFLRSTENIIQDQVGYTRNNVQNPNEIIRLNQYEQSDYLNFQAFGTYKLTNDDKHSLKGGYSYTKTTFEQPDRKFINGTRVNDQEIETTYGGNHLIRQFLNVDGNFYVSGMLEYKLKFGNKEDKNELSFGYNGYVEDLKSTYRFIFGRPNGFNTPSTVNLNNIDTALQNDNSANLFFYQEGSNGDYKTKIKQNVNAGYTNLFLRLSEKFEVNTGLRLESTNREVKYRTISDPISSPYRKQTIEKIDFLPSLNAKYKLNETNNLRLAFGKTITRPVLIEAIPIQYVNADGTTERGNPNLVNSENFNLDIKYEIFPTPKELIAATIFGKYIDKPIERTIEAAATGSGQIITYFNNDNATLFGFEFEVLTQLSRISDKLEGFSAGFNTSLMYTNAIVDKNRQGYFDTFEERKLQGASNWLINADLKYEFKTSENFENTITMVYGVNGERIYAVGIAGLDHIYEKPFNKLDLVWGTTIYKKWDVKLGINNILNPNYIRELGSESKISIDEPSRDLLSFRRGTGFSLNVAYTF